MTIAGLLMFGRDETLREAFPEYYVDYHEWMSDDPAARWTDRLCMDGTWQPNLFQFYLRTMQRLLIDVKLPFSLDDKWIRKGETPMHEAIREALVNALIHADYAGQGGIVIEKRLNMFAFSNPGALLISLKQVFQGGVSVCRNKALQTMFSLMGSVEKAGSGVDKIRKAWQSQHWRVPTVREQTKPDRVYWYLPMISLIPESAHEKLVRLFGEKWKQLKPNEIIALVTADVESSVDNARMQQLCDLHSVDITHLLQKLVTNEMLIQTGKTRSARYSLPSSPHENTDSLHMDTGSLFETYCFQCCCFHQRC